MACGICFVREQNRQIERNTGSEAINAASSEDGWSDVPVESPNAWMRNGMGAEGACIYDKY